MPVYSHLVRHSLSAVPPPPARYLIEDWYFDQRLKCRIANDKHQLADRVMSDADRLIDEAGQTTLLNKNEVDHRIDEKIQSIEFMRNEIDLERQKAMSEIEKLSVFQGRIIICLNVIKQNLLISSQKCILLRERRLGIDLVVDEVEKQLHKELSTIQAASVILTKSSEQASEQMRRLRSTMYFLDRDFESKTNALKIDSANKSLTASWTELNLYQGPEKLSSATITDEQWYAFSASNIQKASMEINSGRQLRSYIDTILCQASDDLKRQYDIVNDVLNARINETKEVKLKLEIKHAESVRQGNELTLSIAKLDLSLSEKQGYLALAHTRLGNRAQRRGVECCKDEVEMKLMREVQELKYNIEKLQQMITEAKASLRYIQQSQIQLEEDMNVKMNSLKIDEVDCIPIRQQMQIQQF